MAIFAFWCRTNHKHDQGVLCVKIRSKSRTIYRLGSPCGMVTRISSSVRIRMRSWGWPSWQERGWGGAYTHLTLMINIAMGVATVNPSHKQQHFLCETYAVKPQLANRRAVLWRRRRVRLSQMSLWRARRCTVASIAKGAYVIWKASNARGARISADRCPIWAKVIQGLPIWRPLFFMSWQLFKIL